MLHNYNNRYIKYVQIIYNMLYSDVIDRLNVKTTGVHY